MLTRGWRVVEYFRTNWRLHIAKEESCLNEQCLILDENIKILDVVKKQKMSYREITKKKIKFGKGGAFNLVENETRLRVEYQKFHGKSFNSFMTEIPII